MSDRPPVRRPDATDLVRLLVAVDPAGGGPLCIWCRGLFHEDDRIFHAEDCPYRVAKQYLKDLDS